MIITEQNNIIGIENEKYNNNLEIAKLEKPEIIIPTPKKINLNNEINYLKNENICECINKSFKKYPIKSIKKTHDNKKINNNKYTIYNRLNDKTINTNNNP